MAATKTKPKITRADAADVAAALTKRVDMLLDKIHALEKEVDEERTVRKAHERLIDRYEREKKMAAAAVEKPKKIKAPVDLGAVVFYTSKSEANAPVAPALVIGTHDDGKVDLRVQLGYCQGTEDISGVDIYKEGKGGKDDPVPSRAGTYSKELPKDDEPGQQPAAKPHAEH